MLYYLYYILSDIFYNGTSVNEIIPNLWLGNYKTAHDINFLKENKINLILNCTPDISFIDEKIIEELKIETYRIPVNDSLLEKDIILMEDYLKIFIPLLFNKYIVEKKNILIHCHAGKQRSAIVVAALLKVLIDKQLIKLTNRTNDQFTSIYNYLLEKRPQVFTYGLRVNFEKSYKRFFKLDK
jgi:protein tyrosine/serine phosphatase